MSFGTSAVRNTTVKEWQAPYFNQPTWTRNANWLAMPVLPDTATQINALYAVYDNGSNYVSFTITGTGTTSVDWGDGTSNTYASGALAQHQYNFSDPDLTTTSEVYKQGMIVITTSGTITGVNFTTRPTGFTVNAFPQNILDLQIITPNCSTFSFMTSTTRTSSAVSYPVLEHIYLQKAGGALNISSGFAGMVNLRQVDFGSTVSFSVMSFLFFQCRNLITVNGLVKNSTVGGASSMVSGCSELTVFPSIQGLEYINDFNSMCAACVNLKYFPSDFWKIGISATGCGSSFLNCYSLETAPFIQFGSSLTSANSMFNNCYNLKSVPLYNFSNVTTGNGMFDGCRSLTSVPQFDFSKITSAASLFANCYSLKSVPAINVSSATSCATMFNNCNSLEECPVVTTSNTVLTTVSQMFSGCNNMKNFVPFATGAVTAFNAMFLNCESLTDITAITSTNTNSGTTFAQIFQGCSSLKVGPAITMPAATTANGMFDSCISLTSVPLYDFNGVTTTASMFLNCGNLTQIPTFDMSTVTTLGSMFSGCASLQNIPALNLSAATSFTSFNLSNFALSRMTATGINQTISIATCNLSATALDEIYTNLSATGAGKTITVTSNWGTASDNPAIATAKGWTVVG